VTVSARAAPITKRTAADDCHLVIASSPVPKDSPHPPPQLQAAAQDVMDARTVRVLCSTKAIWRSMDSASA
jgi:hypothetical protein